MTIFGWDMSHFDAPSIGNAISEGIEFITHKAGGDSNDVEIGAWWSGIVEEAQIGHVLAGAYWVLYPGDPSGRADAFIARLDSTCPGWRAVPFMLQVDCEKWNGDASTVPSRAEIQAFCARLEFRMPKLKPIVYGPKWVYGDGLRGLTYPLWASSYVVGSGAFRSLYPGDSSSRWAAYSGQTPAVLQYTSSATIGGQNFSDANAFRGTRAQLMALVAPGWSTDMELTDHIIDSKTGVDYGTLNGVFVSLLKRSDATANSQLPALADAVAAIPALDTGAVVASVITGVLAGLTPEVLAAIPEDLAQQVVDAFSARLAS